MRRGPGGTGQYPSGQNKDPQAKPEQSVFKPTAGWIRAFILLVPLLIRMKPIQQIFGGGAESIMPQSCLGACAFSYYDYYYYYYYYYYYGSLLVVVLVVVAATLKYSWGETGYDLKHRNYYC